MTLKELTQHTGMAMLFLFYFKEKGMCEHYTIEDVTDDEIQHIQDCNEAFYFDLKFPDPYDQAS